MIDGYDCETSGHLWSDDDACKVCGESWRERYEIHAVEKSDGSAEVWVTERKVPSEHPL